MTRYGICELSVISVRKTPSDRSEMVNQLLFGDLVSIEEFQSGWLKIISLSDNYVGWVDKKQVTMLTDEEYSMFSTTETRMFNDVFTEVWHNNKLLNIVMGSRIHGYDSGTFFIRHNKYIVNNEPRLIPEKTNSNLIIEKAKLLLGAPYLWGGKSPLGIDCSGFTQIVYSCCGIAIYRDASQQSEQGTTIDFIEESQPGDLAFFDNEEGIITHVGILLNTKQIIHASGKVRIDSIDHQGIYNNEEKKYTHKLRIIKRLF